MKKEVQEYIMKVLETLKARFPHPERNHHFVLGVDGRLWLWIAVDDVFQSIIFDEDYTDMEPIALVDDIVLQLKKAGYATNN